MHPWGKEEILTVYRRAFSHYEGGFFREALSLFQDLVMHLPHNKECWRGFSSSLQMLGCYDEAISSWSIFSCLDPNDPYPYLYIAECYLAIDKGSDAEKALTELKRISPLPADILKRLETL
jgi:tetratricopeptide (TPR) repeat protein